MHVSEIELVNFKSIKEFKTEFNGGVYLITGENEVGKSTLLGAITMLLTGDRSDNLLKQGEAKGHAQMKVDGYTVKVSFTEKNPRGTISISTEDGMTSNNKSMLQQIFAYSDFDAHEFVSWSTTADGRKKQVEIVKSLLSEAEQTKLLEIDRNYKELYDQRTEINSQLQASKIILEKHSVNESDAEKYKEEIDIQALYDEKSQVGAWNEKYDAAEQRQAEREKQIHSWNDVAKKELADHDENIKDLEERLAKAKNQREIHAKKLDAQRAELVETSKQAADWLSINKRKDIADIDMKIAEAEHHNAKHKEVVQYAEAKTDYAKADEKKQKHEEKMEALKESKKKIIANSKLPVDGLTFNEDGLFLNNVPFAPNEVSTSQEMEVAAKLMIAKNPKVKVFKISQGESLGATKLKSIVEFAEKNGYQGFIEEVRRGQSELIVENYSIKE